MIKSWDPDPAFLIRPQEPFLLQNDTPQDILDANRINGDRFMECRARLNGLIDAYNEREDATRAE